MRLLCTVHSHTAGHLSVSMPRQSVNVPASLELEHMCIDVFRACRESAECQ